MKIEIYKHSTILVRQPSMPVLIPGTPFYCIPNPTKCVARHLEDGTSYEIPTVEGPISDFCVRIDLEKGLILIEGRSKAGFFRVPIGGQKKILKHPRLSFGNHRSLNWSQVIERDNMLELMPLLYAATYGYPQGEEQADTLLRDKELHDILRAGFTGVFVPTENGLWGYQKPSTSLKPLEFLGAVHALIESKFIKDGEIFRPETECGRMTNVKQEACTVHFEWTRYKLRRLVVDVEEEGDFRFLFPKEMKQFRLRALKSETGTVHANGSPLHLLAKRSYYLDHFE